MPLYRALRVGKHTTWAHCCVFVFIYWLCILTNLFIDCGICVQFMLQSLIFVHSPESTSNFTTFGLKICKWREIAYIYLKLFRTGWSKHDKKVCFKVFRGKGKKKRSRWEICCCIAPRFPNVGLLLLLLFVLFQTQHKLSKIWSKCSRVLKEFYVEGTISSKDDANME